MSGQLSNCFKKGNCGAQIPKVINVFGNVAKNVFWLKFKKYNIREYVRQKIHKCMYLDMSKWVNFIDVKPKHEQRSNFLSYIYFSRVVYVVVTNVNLIKEISEIFCKFHRNIFYLVFSEFKKNDRLARDLYTLGIVGWAYQKHQKIAVRRRRITSYKPSPRSTPRKPLYTVLS